MCIIYACHSGRPSEKLLERGWEGNTDGAGLMWWDEKAGKIRWDKGLELKDAKKWNKSLPMPYAIHFRNSSMGDGGIYELTHPFPVTKDAETSLQGEADEVLMHNGHWHNWDITMKDFALRHRIRVPNGKWSDSRAFAFMAFHLGREIIPLLDRVDRLVTLRVDEDAKGKFPVFEYYGTWRNPEKVHHEKGFLLSTEVDKKVNYTGTGNFSSSSSTGTPSSTGSTSPKEGQSGQTAAMTPTGSSIPPPATAPNAKESSSTTSSAPKSAGGSDAGKASGTSTVPRASVDFALEDLKGFMSDLGASRGKVGHA